MGKVVNERDAYRAFHRRDRMLQNWKRSLRRIGLEIESIELDMADSLARQASEEAAGYKAAVRKWVETLFNDKAFNRTLRRYTGHSPYGWSVASGVDGRMKALLENPGWGVLQEVIHRIRVAKGMEGGARC